MSERIAPMADRKVIFLTSGTSGQATTDIIQGQAVTVSTFVLTDGNA